MDYIFILFFGGILTLIFGNKLIFFGFVVWTIYSVINDRKKNDIIRKFTPSYEMQVIFASDFQNQYSRTLNYNAKICDFGVNCVQKIFDDFLRETSDSSSPSVSYTYRWAKEIANRYRYQITSLFEKSKDYEKEVISLVKRKYSFVDRVLRDYPEKQLYIVCKESLVDNEDAKRKMKLIGGLFDISMQYDFPIFVSAKYEEKYFCELEKQSHNYNKYQLQYIMGGCIESIINEFAENNISLGDCLVVNNYVYISFRKRVDLRTKGFAYSLKRIEAGGLALAIARLIVDAYNNKNDDQIDCEVAMPDVIIKELPNSSSYDYTTEYVDYEKYDLEYFPESHVAINFFKKKS